MLFRSVVSNFIVQALKGEDITIYGDGMQTRAFCYVDDLIDGWLRLMNHTPDEFTGPVNIGSEEMVTINQLVSIVADIAGKKIEIDHIPGPLGVRGRNSHNELIRKMLGWEPKQPLKAGLEKTYAWIEAQVRTNRPKAVPELQKA